MTYALESVKWPDYQGAQGPRALGAHTVGLELLANVQSEIIAMHADHFEEVEGWHDYPFDPDYERMKAMEANYQLLLFTLRDKNDLLVGNLAFTLGFALTSKNVFVATEIALYIKPEHRKGVLALGMVIYAEDILRSIEVNSVCISDKAVAGAGGTSIAPLMKRLEFRPAMTGYEKSLGD